MAWMISSLLMVVSLTFEFGFGFCAEGLVSGLGTRALLGSEFGFVAISGNKKATRFWVAAISKCA
jgi:hypothetical protein